MANKPLVLIGGGIAESTTPRVTALYDINGNIILEIVGEASAVNYLQVHNRPAGFPPYLQVVGPTANNDFAVVTAGTGGVQVYSPSATSIPLKATGGATDVGWNFTTQGAGLGQLNGVQIVAVAPGASGNVPTSNGSGGWTSAAPSGGGVPIKPAAGYTVASNTQSVFFTDIDMTVSTLDLTVNGMLQGVR